MQSLPNRPGILQRKCTCGRPVGPDGECAECKKKRQASQLQRKASGPAASAQPLALSPQPSVAPPLVQEVLRSSGQPLDASTRAFMEPRFGHDFSAVRVHTGPEADRTARTMNARAYTDGRHLVFGAGEYAPSTEPGKKLLAHELTHVMQRASRAPFPASDQADAPGTPAELEADRAADRVVGSPPEAAPVRVLQSRPAGISRKGSGSSGPVNCPAGQHGAPAGADQVLDRLEFFAMLATTVASMDLSSLQLDAVLPGLGAKGGFTMPVGTRLNNYQQRFGLPTAAGRGQFRNRLTGSTFSSQAEALVEESKSLQGRYEKISDLLGGGNARFLCITNPTTIGGCKADCSGTPVAFGCPTVIMLCPGFWTMAPDVQSQLLIHEAAHSLFGILHNHNFTHADCYAAYAADAQGKTSPTTPVCVP